HNEFDLALNGPTAIAFAEEDELASAKGAKSGVDKFKSLEIKCGMFGNKFADKNTVVALASVPDRQTLLSMLVSVLSAPMRGLAIALNAVAEKQAQ
ncbi:MAG: 50S ribosomal protein L10, partial [Clostridia bacterium]